MWNPAITCSHRPLLPEPATGRRVGCGPAPVGHSCTLAVLSTPPARFRSPLGFLPGYAGAPAGAAWPTGHVQVSGYYSGGGRPGSSAKVGLLEPHRRGYGCPVLDLNGAVPPHLTPTLQTWLPLRPDASIACYRADLGAARVATRCRTAFDRSRSQAGPWARSAERTKHDVLRAAGG